MRKAAAILGLAVLVLAGFAAWRIAAAYVANAELQSDMKDLAVQNPARTGLREPDTEEELRNAVLDRAREYGIQLAPEQVVVQRELTPGQMSARGPTPATLKILLAADYEARVNLIVTSLIIHFSPSSSHSEAIVWK
jgi:hypothetical protein